jgi:hypothetical protein
MTEEVLGGARNTTARQPSGGGDGLGVWGAEHLDGHRNGEQECLGAFASD